MDAFGNIRLGAVADWRAAGLSTRRLYSLVRSGDLVKLRHGVYARRATVAEAESDPAERHALDVAAVRLTRPGQTVASHHSAAVIWGLDLLTRRRTEQ